MKKFTLVLAFVLCLGLLSACAGPQGPAGPEGPAGQVVTNTIYKLGDEVMVSQNGYDLFKIKYVSNDADSVTFAITGINNMPVCSVGDVVKVWFGRSDGSGANGTPPTATLSTTPTTWKTSRGDFTVARFYSPATFWTLAIFEI